MTSYLFLKLWYGRFMQYDIEPTSMTNIMVKWYKKQFKTQHCKIFSFSGSQIPPTSEKKPELHRIDCWWNCVNGVADLLWLGFSNAPLDLESERRPSMKSISRQLNCEIMLGVNRLYIYTGRDRVSLFDMTLKCLENISGKLFYFGPYVFISFR